MSLLVIIPAAAAAVLCLCFLVCTPYPRRRKWYGLGALMAALILLAAPTLAADGVRIPTASVQYRLTLERVAGEHFGLNAPVARLAAQVHQESSWNPKAQSAYADGLAQFTPATAAWLPSVCPGVGQPDPWDPNWSLRAMACYDAWLLARAPGDTACDRWAMTLSAYNGGEAARDRERAKASAEGMSADRWFGAVAKYRSRSPDNWRQNRHYVRHILLTLEPAYLAAGWPGQAVCHE